MLKAKNIHLVDFSEMFARKDKGLCPFCGKKVNVKKLRDKLSKDEFKISGICQKCQDKTFDKKEKKI